MHHSLTKDGEEPNWGAIRRYHTVDKGWRDIGYHYGIEMVRLYPEILLGRLPYQVGAHTKQQGMNKMSLGVCVVGNFDIHPPRQEVWLKALALVRYLLYAHNLVVTAVHAHRDYAPYKTCPGLAFNMDKFRSEL
ncbi:MAG: peptidoglycan recognition protein family protein [Candidatus Thorarchaeota archaeon]